MEIPGRAARIIFEKGLEIRCDESGVWSFLRERTTQANVTPSAIAHEYKVRPVLFIEEHPSGKDLISVLSTQGEQTPNPFSVLDVAPSLKLTTPFLGLSYVVGATSYHCGRLANLYAETWRSFHTGRLASSSEKNMIQFVQYGFQEEGYYELDALVTSVIRCYETLRFVIWSAFEKGKHSKNGPRKNFEETLKACESLPAELSNRLQKSWLNFGGKAKSYRDFILHYFPLDRGFASATMERLKDNVWSVSLWLPDNPESKSPKEFRYDSKIDALTYGWELSNEVFEVTWLVAHEVLAAQNPQAG